MNLYWLESDDHSEDWFVAAKSEVDAIDFYACEMGYDVIDDVLSAQFVCMIPYYESLLDTTFASENLIKDCGGEIIFYIDPEIRKVYTDAQLALLGSETRIVKIDNKTYIEGNVAQTVVNELQLFDKSNLN